MRSVPSARSSTLGRTVIRLLLPMMLVVGVAACGSSSKTASTSGSSPAGSSANMIVIKNFAFSPASDTVKAGATITVKNEDQTAHTLTATGSAKGMFDTGNLGPGQTKTFTAPSKPGTYPYLCQIHNYMTGTLNVS